MQLSSPFLVRPDAFSVVIIACIINGFCSYALFPVYLEVASESKPLLLQIEYRSR